MSLPKLPKSLVDGLELAVEWKEEGVAHLFKCAGNIFSTLFLKFNNFSKSC